MTALKTTNIKGKYYVEVNTRLKYFREHFPGWSLETELVELNDDTCLMRAVVRNPDGQLVATGTAYERKDSPSSMVNKTSHIENCETSAWGRALGNLGIGIDASVASADEVEMAVMNQDNTKPAKPTQQQEIPASPDQLARIGKLIAETNSDRIKLYAFFKISAPTAATAPTIIDTLERKLTKQLDDATKANS